MRLAAAIAVILWAWLSPAHARTADTHTDSVEHAVASYLYPVIEPNSAGTPGHIFAKGLRDGASDSTLVQYARAVLVGESVSRIISRDFGSLALGIEPSKIIALLCAYIQGELPPMPARQAQQTLEKAYADAMNPRAATADPDTEAAFMKKAASSPDARILDGGVVLIPVSRGPGATPAPGSTVLVAYTATLSDGTVFDSTGSEPAALEYDSLVPGMRTGLAAMQVGDKSTLYIPAPLAYGEEGFPGVIPGGSALRFDIELIEIRQ